MAQLIVVTGGARSGKSNSALALARRRGTRRAFIATAEAHDAEMRARIARHRADRSGDFETVEAPLKLAEALASTHDFDVVVVDCATLYLSNLMHSKTHDQSKDDSLATDLDLSHHFDRLVSALIAHPGEVIVVTNEVGLGIVPLNALARSFRDHHGRLNQALAAAASELYFMVSGIGLRLKPAPVETISLSLGSPSESEKQPSGRPGAAEKS
jgi:adenosylcobinamide kinase/adenosylcobinamide-phosphate guanylyltransferase